MLLNKFFFSFTLWTLFMSLNLTQLTDKIMWIISIMLDDQTWLISICCPHPHPQQPQCLINTTPPHLLFLSTCHLSEITWWSSPCIQLTPLNTASSRFINIAVDDSIWNFCAVSLGARRQVNKTTNGTKWNQQSIFSRRPRNDNNL